MRTGITFTFDENISEQCKVNAIRDFINNCEKDPYYLEVGTQLSGILFDPSDNKGFYRVGVWSIDTLEV